MYVARVRCASVPPSCFQRSTPIVRCFPRPYLSRPPGRQDLLKITTKQMPGVPREVVQQVYSLLAVAWGSQEIPVETLAMACTALELSTLKRGGGH